VNDQDADTGELVGVYLLAALGIAFFVAMVSLSV
jgi:hypothetical protein